MSRWEPDAPGRLARAALDLYGEHGFDDTTVAQIAERAGLTERTFFRYYADKREVLFAGAGELQARLVNGVVEAPSSAAPIEAVAHGLDAAAGLFVDRRTAASKRHAVIVANPGLQERELIKLATLAATVADALRQRGVPDPAAGLAAEAGIAVFKVAFERWVSPSNRQALSPLIGESLAQLRSVTAGT